MSLFFAGVVPPTSYWGPVRPPDFPHESLRARRKVVEDPPGKVKKKSMPGGEGKRRRQRRGDGND